MKTKYIMLLSLSLVGFASAQSVNVDNLANFDEAQALPIFDNAGNSIGASDLVISLGLFENVAPNAALEGFRTFSSETITNDNNGNFINDSISFEGPASGTGSAEDLGFVGRSVFVVLQSTSTGDIAIFESANNVNGNTDVPGGAPLIGSTAVEISNSGGTLVVGNLLDDVTVPGAPDTFSNGIQLVAVPEPSSALLAGLALVGGLIRRRR